MQWSWKSHEFSLQVKSGPLTGPPMIARWIRGLTAADEAPTSVVIGAGGEVLDRTDPAYEPGKGSIKAIAKDFRLFLPAVTGFGLVRLSQLDFTLTIKSLAGLIDLPIIDTVDFAFTSASDDKEQGSADVTMTDLEIQCIKILRNGVQL